MRIDGSDNVTVTPIPRRWYDAVGLIAGPGASDGVWFTCRQQRKVRQDTSDGQFHWYQLGARQVPMRCYISPLRIRSCSTPAFFGCCESLLDSAQPDALVRVEFSPDYANILSQEIVPLEQEPRPQSDAVFGLLRRTVLATELALTRIAVVDNGLLP